MNSFRWCMCRTVDVAGIIYSFVVLSLVFENKLVQLKFSISSKELMNWRTVTLGWSLSFETKLKIHIWNSICIWRFGGRVKCILACVRSSFWKSVRFTLTPVIDFDLTNWKCIPRGGGRGWEFLTLKKQSISLPCWLTLKKNYLSLSTSISPSWLPFGR